MVTRKDILQAELLEEASSKGTSKGRDAYLLDDAVD
jgi:hypothetical protein